MVTEGKLSRCGILASFASPVTMEKGVCLNGKRLRTRMQLRRLRFLHHSVTKCHIGKQFLQSLMQKGWHVKISAYRSSQHYIYVDILIRDIIKYVVKKYNATEETVPLWAHESRPNLRKVGLLRDYIFLSQNFRPLCGSLLDHSTQLCKSAPLSELLIKALIFLIFFLSF